MSKHTIFGHKYCHQRLGITEKQAVMSDAQAQQHIEFAAVLVEQLGLRDRIAQDLRMSSAISIVGKH